MKLVQLGDHYFNYDAIGVVRESALGDEQTIVFLQGSSAMDGGFLVDLPIDDVLEVLEDARLEKFAAVTDSSPDE